MCVPRYQKHSSGQARVVINGKVYYLGKFSSKASKQRYDALIAEWLASGRSSFFGLETEKLTMANLMVAYLKHAKAYYGEGVNSEYSRFKSVLRTVAKLYSSHPIEDFGPAQYKAIRQLLVEQDLSRTFINAQMKRILRMFKWGASEGMYPPSIYETLRLISGLRAGKTEARETDAVKPVPEAKVEQTLKHCSQVVADMIKVQLLTGCRPGEVCRLTPEMIDRSKDVWEARLVQHKTAHRGKERVIYIGPQAQRVIVPYLLRESSQCLFQPRDAMRRLRESRSRSTPENQGNRGGYSKRQREGRTAIKSPGTSYTTHSYAKAIAYGCKKAFPEPENATLELRKAWRAAEWWSPNQLRHTAATKLRKEFGLDAAGVILGHSQLSVTQVYAEADRQKAAEIQRQIG